MTKPRNFPERKRQRKVKALIRLGVTIPVGLKMELRDRRTKRDRSWAVKKGD